MEAYLGEELLTPETDDTGFLQYLSTLNASVFLPNLIVYGIWTQTVPDELSGKIRPKDIGTKNWYIIDIYDPEKRQYWKQYDVRRFAIHNHMSCVKTLYAGTFHGWEEIRSRFLTGVNPKYADGIVIKNTRKLTDKYNTHPAYLQIPLSELKK